MSNEIQDTRGKTTEDRAAEALLNAYLERVNPNLVYASSYHQHESLRIQIREEIEGLAAAHRELGSGPFEAMRAAIEQFGRLDGIGSAMTRAKTISSRRSMLARFRSRLVTAVTSGVVGALLSRFVDLSLVSSGLVTYDSGFLMVALGLLMGFLTGLAIGGKRNSFGLAALK